MELIKNKIIENIVDIIEKEKRKVGTLLIKIKTKEEETLNNCNTQNSSNNNTGNESNSIRKVLFKII